MRKLKVKEVMYLSKVIQNEAMLGSNPVFFLLLIALVTHNLELRCLVQRPKHHSLIHSFIYTEYLSSVYIVLSTVLSTGDITVKKAPCLKDHINLCETCNDWMLLDGKSI